ncbi:hypothetical protein [Olsenella sp. HMSC062G07]|nr:hypothetical protein [Olsenella sp. HMSC062G07]
MIDREKASGCVTTLLVALLIDAAALYGIVWLVTEIGRMMGWLA